jgi:hypothetical protein
MDHLALAVTTPDGHIDVLPNAPIVLGVGADRVVLISFDIDRRMDFGTAFEMRIETLSQYSKVQIARLKSYKETEI